MRDFVMREKIEERDGIKVTRTRTSAGYAAISVHIEFPSKSNPAADSRFVSFTFDSDDADPNYEGRARVLRDTLDAIINETCGLLAPIQTEGVR